MNWLRLLEIIEMARRRTGNRSTAGWSWVCYCTVCAAIRAEEPDVQK